MPRHVEDDFWEYIGPGALITLILAMVLAVVGLLLPVFWRMRTVRAFASKDQRSPSDALLVLGQLLVDNQPTLAFRGRLDHALVLWRQGVAPLIIVAGGRTGRSSLSEAEAGRDYLLAADVPKASMLVEDRSRNTLENLFNVRETLHERGMSAVTIVSNPMHLARAAAIAKGLSMPTCCSAAPGTDPPRNTWAWRLGAFREAFMVHWYHTGMAYSRMTRSDRMLRRVT